MAQHNRLSALKVAKLSDPGRYADGRNLYLQVDRSGAKRWMFIYRRNGRQREMGLGGLDRVGLAEARSSAEAARAALARGDDPIEARKAIVRVPTFGEFADEFVASHAPAWRNAKHRAQWMMTLTIYAAPFRSKAIDNITTDDVLAVLKPIWATKPETATRLRGRIERVLDAAKAKGLRSGENPARWRGHLATLLPPPKKLSRGHHAALAYQTMPVFMSTLRHRDGVAARALEFAILTAGRTGEVINASWAEIDMAARTWTIPADRMKAGREHRVPLSARAMEILSIMDAVRTGSFIFPGAELTKPLSSGAFAALLKRMDINVTAHGFRSTFRVWIAEQTTVPAEIAEQALAHVNGDRVAAAYQRSDLLDPRRKLMDAWDFFCATEAETDKANFFPIGGDT